MMENLRWILIFAGVAILVLLYFSGRSGSPGSNSGRVGQGRSNGDSRRDRHSGGHGQRPGDGRRRGAQDADGGMHEDPLMEQGAGVSRTAPRLPDDLSADFDGFEVDPSDLERPASARAPHDFEAPEARFDDGRSHRRAGPPAEHVYADEMPASGYPADEGEMPRAASGGGEPAAGALGGLSQKIEAIGARLSSRRAERVAANAPDDDADGTIEPAFASKIVTLHVLARDEELFDGQTLIDCFERRGLEFGDMNIFHSMHHGKTVFSVAKTVEPGYFDPHDLHSFTTPGITLILQLPGPVAADTAFEVLLAEAHEIAAELDGRVLDGDRSTLSKQAAQHMREGIYEYMHRQKYFGSVAS